MLAQPQGRFADEEVEGRYQTISRTLRRPFVRLYAVMLMVVMLGYGLIHPFYARDDEMMWLSLYATLTLLLLGGYVAVTFWERYPQAVMLDFCALLGLSLLLALSNAVLFNVLIEQHQSMHAIRSLNRLIITAFAAFALAGRMRMFLAWLAFDFIIFSVVAIHAQAGGAGFLYAMMSYSAGAMVMTAISFAIGRSSRGAFAMSEELNRERLRNEQMLHNVLPAAAAERLKAGQLVADSFSDATVIFIDIVGFSVLAKRISPGHLIELLNGFFRLADRCTVACDVEKVKTIGDAYLAISGGNSPSRNSAASAIHFAQAVIAGLAEIRRETGIDLHIRVGIHSGPVVGGVIGETRMAYDYWGETMNIAARIEGTAPPDGIAVSESTHARTQGLFDFGPPQMVLLKGVGETPVYHLADEALAKAA